MKAKIPVLNTPLKRDRRTKADKFFLTEKYELCFDSHPHTDEQLAAFTRMRDEIEDGLQAGFSTTTNGDMMSLFGTFETQKAFERAGLLVHVIEDGSSHYAWSKLLAKLNQVCGVRVDALSKTTASAKSTAANAEPFTTEQALKEYHRIQTVEGQSAADRFYSAFIHVLNPNPAHRARA